MCCFFLQRRTSENSLVLLRLLFMKRRYYLNIETDIPKTYKILHNFSSNFTITYTYAYIKRNKIYDP